jgi:hypothetical protein
LTGYGKSDRLAGNIFYAQPGLENQGKIDDPKDYDQKDG